ncbi:hypothetical protein [Histidinibacterium lentulum]|uniref:hypothetical protein n=1 Tax=Histidinibacterium lentulum TaxID=2480588 RepID=UPI001614FC76|nr:hypothetical protein [Histidinibacterium lentulum]
MVFETELTAALCAFVLGGEVEVRHDFTLADDRSHIRVDCETESHVYEVGLDARTSSYDSVSQALFAAELTGKLPAVVIIDTNGIEDHEEYRVRVAARAAGITYLTIDRDFLIRMQMAWPFRLRKEHFLGPDELAALN